MASKGIPGLRRRCGEQVLPALRAATRHGELPVVCDASSCTEGLRQMLEIGVADGQAACALRIVDAVAFVDEQVLPALSSHRDGGRVGPAPDLLVHPDGDQRRAAAGGRRPSPSA